MRAIPPQLLTRPFTRAEAHACGVTSRMLEGRRFVRVFGSVWRHRDHTMSHLDWIAAAAMTLPPDAHPTGITRIQMLGLDYGPRRPLRFVREGDLHRDIEGIFLHRTKRLAPLDDDGVVAAAAFQSYCSLARTIDAIKVGDWLLHRRHTTIEQLEAFALSGLWRAGADEVLWVLAHLDARSRSLMESETRVVLSCAGLAPTGVNVPVPLSEDLTLIGDLVYVEQRGVVWGIVEYEGEHHQQDREQYGSDIDRYAILRAEDIAYVQATKEKLAKPRTLVGEVYRMLVARGYDGPPPRFDAEWRQLFMRLSDVVGEPDGRVRAQRAVS